MPITPVSKIWMDGSMVDWADAQVHVLSHALHYGSGVFEGIRAYPTDRGPAIFRLREHMVRLEESARILMMDMPYTVDELCDATIELIKVNEMESGYIRPLVFLGYGEMGLNPLTAPVSAMIAAWPWGTYLGEEGLTQGVRLKVSSWKRHDPNISPPAVKCSGFYVNSSLAKVEALKAGYDEAVMLNGAGFVSECTGENIYIVKDGVVITPPLSAGALDGITRRTVLRIANDLGYETREANLVRTDLYLAEEAFVSGTAAEVVPVRSVDDRPIPARGPITQRIQETYFSAVRGELDQYKEWLDYVE
ncbi:MAG: branched-chain amino acid transaminase [Acidimicrobiia bacterium]|nr:branched-chain amino acid transaminase [Acidimicrobiia bacterium]MBP8182044.1 branched-chain amino acid transaminase [Acidimicrobiia bacterium]